MAKKNPEPTRSPRERAFLVGVDLRNEPSLLSLDDSLDELALLADTAGLEVVGETYQRLDKPSSDTFIGSGKLEEIKALVEENLAQVVIFDNELAPRHLRELEERLGPNVRIIDRTALILDIFAQHAQTREGVLQVELAQYEYRLPRLTRAWTHLARQTGGGGGRTGSSGSGPARNPQAHLQPPGRVGKGSCAPPALPQPAPAVDDPHRSPGRLYKLRKIDPAQPAGSFRSFGREPAFCHARSNNAPGRTARRA